MNSAMIGGLVGLALGIVGFAVCQMVASKVANNTSLPDRERVARTWRMLAVGILVMDTLVGYFLGPLVLDA